MAKSGLCAVDGCGKAIYQRQWCQAHYLRWYRHGDPTAGGPSSAAKGEPLAWARRHVNHEGEGCLIWPFGRTGSGYGALYDGRPQQLAHRWMCERAHGPALSKEHEATHSCGNGHLACVHPKHLSWGTAVQNAADRDRHGRTPKGESHSNAKLTAAEVSAIWALRGHQSQEATAKQFGVSKSAIGFIWAGRSWAWLTGARNDHHRAARRAWKRRDLSGRRKKRVVGPRGGEAVSR